MLKLTAIVSLMLIGSTLWAASLSCDSCGSECASACGTRHFRSCCFNYLRRKRGPESLKLLSSTGQEIKAQPDRTSRTEVPKSLPAFVVERVPDQWMSNMIPSEYRPYYYDDTIENRLFDV